MRFGIPIIAANVRAFAPNGSMAATIAPVIAAAGLMSARCIIVCGADGHAACDGGSEPCAAVSQGQKRKGAAVPQGTAPGALLGFKDLSISTKGRIHEES